jgi:hypothetical protein
MERNCRLIFKFLFIFSLLVSKVDNPLFAQTFQKIYNPSFGNNPIPLGLSQRPDGKYFMAFESSLGTNFVYLTCLNEDGTPLWIKQIDLTEPGNWILTNTYESVTATSDNGCVVTVAFFNPISANAGQHQYLIKFDASGNIEWSKEYEASRSCGDVYIMMTSVGDEIYNIIKECDTDKFHLTRFNNAGVILEEKLSDSPMFCQSLSAANNGSALITAETNNGTNSKSHILKFFPNIGLKTILSFLNYSITSAVEHSNGQIFFSAFEKSNDSFSNSCVIGMAENGQVKWLKKVTFSESLNPTGCLFLSLNKTENQLLLAMANGQTSLLKFDLLGNFLSSFRYEDENECLTKVIATNDGAWAWLHSLQLIVSKADLNLQINNCSPALPCKTNIKDHYASSTNSSSFLMTTVNRYQNYPISLNDLTIMGEDYCPPISLPLNADFQILDSVQCQGIPFEFRRNSIGNDVSNWHFDGGVPESQHGIFNIKTSISAVGKHQITHYIGRGVCSDTTFKQVYVIPSPSPLSFNGGAICEGDSLLLEINPIDTSLILNWDDGSPLKEIWLKEEGEYGYKIENSEGCYTESGFSIDFHPFHDFKLLGEKTPCFGEIPVISLKNVQNYQHVLWNTGSKETNITIENDGWYKVTVKEGECEKKDSLEVIFTHCDTCKVYAPSVFIIDSDVNGQFTFQSNCTITALDLRILDRWGSLVFQTNQPDFRWLGLASGKPVEQGIFIYEATMTLEINSRKEKMKKKGDILVLK